MAAAEASAAPAEPVIYHEKQSLQRCALHTLNNFFQETRFTRARLDELCHRLSITFINPHKSFFGLGNYDVNAIGYAFQQEGYTLVWFDRRKDPRRDLNVQVVEGLVINKKEKRLLGSGRHWFCIRQVGDQFYNLDSKLPKPQPVADPWELAHQYLENPKEDTQLFLVCREEVADQVYLPEQAAQPSEAGAEGAESPAEAADAPGKAQAAEDPEKAKAGEDPQGAQP